MLDYINGDNYGTNHYFDAAKVIQSSDAVPQISQVRLYSQTNEGLIGVELSYKDGKKYSRVGDFSKDLA